MDTNSNMEYRYLGDSGLRVSSLGYGFMDFNDQSLLDEMLPRAVKLGINFIDCAEIYGTHNAAKTPGTVESLLGNSLKKVDVPREDLVITTKFIFGGFTPNRVGLSYKHITEGMKASLKRLQLDYVDVAFAHRDDPATPMEEICRGFNTLIENGDCFYWATSEFTPDRIMEAFDVCDRLGLVRPIADQAEYNMLVRQKMEKDYVNLFENYRYGSTVWGPLCGGLLTGKYNDEVPQDSRMSLGSLFKLGLDRFIGESNAAETIAKLRKLGDVSKQLGCTMSQFSLAWVVNNKDVSTAIIGAKKPAQLEENIKALDFVKSITPEIEAKVEEILGNRPASEMDFRTWTPRPARRTISTK